MGCHLLVAISSHGYGHLAQTAPVVNALVDRIPDLRLTLSTALPRKVLEERIAAPFALEAQVADIGMVMASAVSVSYEESAAAYRRFHRNWTAEVEREAKRLARLRPDLVVANVPYLTLAGAARAGVPAIAMCSLNWADIYGHYFATRPEAATVHPQILAAYNSAACFLQPEPSMPMPGIRVRRSIGPIAALGRNRRDEIARTLGLAREERLVLVTLGGLPMRPPVERWPQATGVRWLVESSWRVRHPDAVELEALGMRFIDILASCDAVVAKPGYGTFAEAGCSGTPLLYVPRPDWPEQRYLVEWLERHGRCLALRAGALEEGGFADALQRLWSTPAPAPVAATGAEEAARYITDNWCV